MTYLFLVGLAQDYIIDINNLDVFFFQRKKHVKCQKDKIMQTFWLKNQLFP